MTPAAIITTTACAYGLAPSALTGRGMQRRVAEARAVAAFLAYELTGVSYAELGALLGRRRHTVHGLVERVAVDRGGIQRRALRVERLLGGAVAAKDADLA